MLAIRLHLKRVARVGSVRGAFRGGGRCESCRGFDPHHPPTPPPAVSPATSFMRLESIAFRGRPYTTLVCGGNLPKFAVVDRRCYLAASVPAQHYYSSRCSWRRHLETRRARNRRGSISPRSGGSSRT